MVRIKICCIKNLREAKLAINLGIDSLGFVSEMPSGPGVISLEQIQRIIKNIPPYISTSLLTSKINFDDISKQLLITKANTIQIVDKVDNEVYLNLKKYFPFIKIIQVIHVLSEKDIYESLKIEKYVDAFLLDSGNPNLRIKKLGGTGRTHDWNISREIRNKVKKPIILAGGLNSDNVREAIKIVNPYAVDVCSGVRTNGILDKNKLLNFIKAVYENN